MKIFFFGCLFSASFALAHAGIIFDNGVGDHLDGGINDPAFDSANFFIRYGDNFSLNSVSTLSGISWFGEYQYTFPPPPPLASESFEFSIFKRSTQVVNVATIFAPVASRVAAGPAFEGGPEFGNEGTLYEYTALLPDLALDAGQYILTISATAHTVPHEYYWSWGSSSPVVRDGSVSHSDSPSADWGPNNTEYAFTLYDGPPPTLSPVPELSLIGPTGAGLLILLVGRKVSRRKTALMRTQRTSGLDF